MATLAVVVLPAVAVSFVGTLASPWLVALSLLLAMAISLAVASVGAAIWARQPGSRDMVFADLMLWGWLRRARAERRLAEARGVLGAGAAGLDAAQLSPDRRCKLLQQLAAQLEAKDSYTLGHSRRVTRHSERIARELGLPDDEVARIRLAASVHDVGKVRTPREVLTKPGRLTDSEYEVVKQHVVDGADMVAGLGDPGVTALVRYHHERLDGSGYPDGLRGDDIPLGARIIAVADTFDAMTSNRPYHRSYKHRRALEVLAQDAGSRLDADAVAAFQRYYSGRRGIAWSAAGLAAQPRLAGWAGGALGGAGGWSAPLANGLAAVFAAALAGVSLGGQATPATAASDQAPTRATQGQVRDADARVTLAGGRAGSSPASREAPAIGRRDARPDPETLDGSPGGPGERPAPPAEGGGTPIVDRSPRPPAAEPPAAEPPAIELPIHPPAVELPRTEVPALEVPSIEVPAIQLPGIETPRIETPRMETPAIEVPGLELPALRVPGA